MFAKIKELFASKKFIMVLLGSAVVGAMQYAGVSHDIITTVASLFGVGVAGQGLADLGKNAK